MNSKDSNARTKVDASIVPGKVMSLLSPKEIQEFPSRSDGQLYDLFRRCALAVLNAGSMEDDVHKFLSSYSDFDIKVVQQSRGVKLAVKNAPGSAFVDGQLIKGIREHLFSVLRDVLYIHTGLQKDPAVDLESSAGLTDAVFRVLRHAKTLKTGLRDQLVICWGGHSINRVEYDYTKAVGYELGLRGLHIGTGCGPGAMKGPMKGAAIGHAKQHIRDGRYIGITEPDIIAAEPPNPIVNELVILPDIEKRLEAFVRMSHGIVVFPGGVGTAEEILYLLGILTHPSNEQLPFPLILTAPEQSRDYFEQINRFIQDTLGPEVTKKYRIIIGDPAEVAKCMVRGIEEVFTYRQKNKDSYYYNWLLHIPFEFQKPFMPTHEAMSALEIKSDMETYQLAANLRRAFSGLVAGNVKEHGVRRIQEQGPYRICGEPQLMAMLDDLLKSFIAQGRMKLGSQEYKPCYRID